MPRFVIQKSFPNFSFCFSILVLEFDIVIQIWWTLVWETFSMITKNDLGLNKFNTSHWWHHQLVLFWYRNSDMNNSWLSCSKDLINFKHPLLSHRHLVTFFYLILDIKLQSFKKYLRQTLVFIGKNTVWEKFNFYFSVVFG